MADTIEKIHQRSRGTYGKRRIRAELLDTYEMNVNHKLVSAIMTELGIAGLPRPGKRKPNLLGIETLVDRVNRGFSASRPNELWFTDITEHPATWIPAIVATLAVTRLPVKHSGARQGCPSRAISGVGR